MRIVLTCVSLFASLFIVIPIWIWIENKDNSIIEKDLLTLTGHVKTIKKTTTRGKHPSPIIYLTIDEDKRIFRIANSSYRAVDDSKLLSLLTTGTEIEMKTKESEIKRSNSGHGFNNLLNSIFEWRGQPQVYALRTKSDILLSTADFNNKEEEFNISNIKWGIILVLFITGRLLWTYYRGEK
jgi:hypothetical protein